MSVTLIRETSSEWFETPQAGIAIDSVYLPEPNTDYAYAAARLLSWFPVVNVKGATYFKEDFDYDLLQTLKGKQANLRHDKTQIVGTIYDYNVNDEGIDIVVEIDRECANLQGLDIEDLHSGQYFDAVSVELTRDEASGFFLAVDDGFNVQNRIPVITGKTIGIRRTTERDPYKLMGNRVVERIKPARFTGVGIVPNPADVTAKVFAVTASEDDDDKEKRPVKNDGIDVYANDHVDMSRDALTPGGDYADPGWQKDGKKRYPLNSPDHVRSASKFFGRQENRDRYSPEHVAEIDHKIESAKKRYGIGDEEKSSESAASSDAHKETQSMNEGELKARIAELEAQVAQLTSANETASTEATTVADELRTVKESLSAKETELASVTAERDELVAANAARETAARVDALVEEFQEFLKCENDEELAALKETAMQYVDDAGRIQTIKLERHNKYLTNKIAALETAPAAEEQPPAGEEAPAANEGGEGSETASDDEIPSFKASRPKVAISPTFTQVVEKKTYDRKELLDTF